MLAGFNVRRPYYQWHHQLPICMYLEYHLLALLNHYLMMYVENRYQGIGTDTTNAIS